LPLPHNETQKSNGKSNGKNNIISKETGLYFSFF